MQPGRMTEKILIREKTSEYDPTTGKDEQTWQTKAELWAEVRGLDQGLQAAWLESGDIRTHEAFIWARSGLSIDGEDVLVWEGKAHQIKALVRDSARDNLLRIQFDYGAGMPAAIL